MLSINPQAILNEIRKRPPDELKSVAAEHSHLLVLLALVAEGHIRPDGLDTSGHVMLERLFKATGIDPANFAA
jgi:hypothetical protein